MKIDISESQLKVMERALHCFSRFRGLQIGIAFEDFNIHPPSECQKHGVRGMVNNYEVDEIEKKTNQMLEDCFGVTSQGINDLDGQISFCMYRQIHAFLHVNQKDCCTCGRASLTSSGEPNIKITK